LFDVSLDLFKTTLSTNERSVTGQVSLLQAGIQDKADVTLIYTVTDFEGNTYLKNSETIMVDKGKTINYEFLLPSLEPGDYLAGVEVIYSGGVATASSNFKVASKIKSQINWILIATLTAILVVLIIVAFFYRRYTKDVKKQNKSAKRKR